MSDTKADKRMTELKDFTKNERLARELREAKAAISNYLREWGHGGRCGLVKGSTKECTCGYDRMRAVEAKSSAASIHPPSLCVGGVSHKYDLVSGKCLLCNEPKVK